jgi:hypothetical protein
MGKITKSAEKVASGTLYHEPPPKFSPTLLRHTSRMSRLFEVIVRAETGVGKRGPVPGNEIHDIVIRLNEMMIIVMVLRRTGFLLLCYRPNCLEA